MKNGRVSVRQGEPDSAGDTYTLLTGQHTKFCWQPLTWAPVEGGWYGLELLEECLEFVALGRDMGDSGQDPSTESYWDTTVVVFPGGNNPHQVAPTWRKTITLPSEIPLTPPG